MVSVSLSHKLATSPPTGEEGVHGPLCFAPTDFRWGRTLEHNNAFKTFAMHYPLYWQEKSFHLRPLGAVVGKQWPSGHILPLPIFINSFMEDSHTLSYAYHLWVLSLCKSVAEKLGQTSMAHKAWNIYYVALWKSWPTLPLKNKTTLRAE